MKRILTSLSVGKKLESGKKYGIVIPSSLYNKNGINTADDYVYEFMLNNPIYETILFLYYGLRWPCCHFL